MHIPRAWAWLSTECHTPDRRTVPVAAWGWGDDEAAARREAAGRLERLVERLRRGEPFPRAYAYGGRPLKEEILETLTESGSGPPVAMLTRNRYGAVVLNTARLLFLDIDVPAPTLPQRLLGRLRTGQPWPDEAVVATLREALRRAGGATFRVYRTASGLRAMAIDCDFDPAGREAQELMKATGTDPAFAHLCRVQKSFRARLTPKPWRWGCPSPPSEHPRLDPEIRRLFDTWLAEYERASAAHATCRYLETVGSASPHGGAVRLIELHDRLTRCGEALPLA